MNLEKYESGAVAGVPSAPSSPSTGKPSNGNPGTATPPTVPGEYWYYQIQEEIRNLVEDEAGLTPDHEDLTQLADAINVLIAAAVPAARLTPQGYINGLTFSKDADAEHDMTLGVGVCRDTADTKDLVIASAITKQIDAVWAEGDDAGGFLPGGGVQSDTEYHLVLIEKDSDGTLDWGFDTSATGNNAPSGWTFRRRLGSRYTDASSNIMQMLQVADDHWFEDPPLDADAVPSTTASSLTLTVPSVPVLARLNITVGSGVEMYLYPTDVDDEACTYTAAPIGTSGETSGDQMNQCEIMTNASSQIRLVSQDNAAGVYRIATIGWTDTRGKS